MGIRKLLGIRSASAECEAAGRELLDLAVKDIRDPRPLTPQETADMQAYAEGVTRRSFPALYWDDEDGEA